MKLRTVLLFTALVGATIASPSDAAPPHFGLRTSSPAADATVTSVDEIRLSFTQVPQEGSGLIRLVNPAGDAVDVGDLTRDLEDDRTLYVSVPAALDPGVYTVMWRGIGDDGHVVRGDFTFTVATGR